VARLGHLRSEQLFLLDRGKPSPRLDPALVRAVEEDDEMERRVAWALANRRLMRRALGRERAAPAGRRSPVHALSLCSGIGGLDLGLSLAVPNYRTVCYAEIDASCQDLLLARMAGGVLDRAPIWGDLKQFDARPWRGLVDLVHGGYPCQPFSVAGNRRGAEDPRHLWPHIAGIVEAVEPEWCLFENVANHLLLGAPAVVRDLGRLGYRVALGFFTAAELGAPHKRERLFILAHADAHRLHGPTPAEVRDTFSEGFDGGRWEDEAVAGAAAMVRPGPAVAVRPERRPALELRPDVPEVWRPRWGYPGLWPPRRVDSWPAWRGVRAVDPSLVLRDDAGLNPTFVEWMMGFPRGWTEGVGRAARLGALGNAVVPAAAALAWRELSAALDDAVSGGT
jgi:DNA (cytosine-5)-methyltransferase 1